MGNSEWIATAERLPPNDDYVLIWGFGEYRLGYYKDLGNRQDSYWLSNSTEWRGDSFDYWMPLPTSPEVRK